MNSKLKPWLIGIGSSIALFFLFGIPTAVISNPWFARMIPLTNLDVFFLITNSILLGVYLGIYYWKKEKNKLCNITSTSGGIAGFLAFGCPICNKLLVLVFGATALMTYLEPYRPILGIISILMILGAIIYLIKK